MICRISLSRRLIHCFSLENVMLSSIYAEFMMNDKPQRLAIHNELTHFSFNHVSGVKIRFVCTLAFLEHTGHI